MKRFLIDVFLIYVVVGLVWFGSVRNAQADDFQVAVAWNDPVAEHTAGPALSLEWQPTDKPIYAYGAVSSGEARLLGQRVGSLVIPELGLGVRHKIGKWVLFGEVGYAYPILDKKQVIIQEVAYTYLVDRHHVEGRPIPVTVLRPYDQDSYVAAYDLQGDIVFGVGVDYEVSSRWGVGLKYRYFTPPNYIGIWDEDKRKNGGGWWHETINADLSSVQFEVNYRF